MQLKEWLLTAALFQGPCFRAIPPFRKMPAGKLGAIFTEQPLKMLGKNRGREISTLVITDQKIPFLHHDWGLPPVLMVGFFKGKAV